jgi:hypothetical protein
MGKKKSKYHFNKRKKSKRFYHTIRKRLISKILRKGKVPKWKRIKYNVNINKKEIIRRKFELYIPETIYIVVPKIFCFKKDPIGTSEFIVDLNKKLKTRNPYNLNISHENTEEIGLSASYLFDKKIKEYRLAWRYQGVEIGLSGKISKKSEKVNNFLLSFGLLNALNISPDKINRSFESKIDNDYKIKYLTIKKEGSKKQPFKKSEASTGLVDYFNQCFNYNGLQITDSAKRSLVETFGEIIGNAEEHCEIENGKWYALGCYDKDEHVCEFTIANIGKTVYENLSNNNSTASEVITRICEVINSNRTYLDQAKQIFQADHDEPIWNVMALQDGISSKRTDHGKGRTRGQGIMDVLSFIDDVKSEKDGATLCFISGRSAIIIDYLYPIIEKEIIYKEEGRKEFRRLIAFNKEGNLHKQPDSKKVIFLKDKIDGTIFSGKFKIDEKYLQEKKGDQKWQKRLN